MSEICQLCHIVGHTARICPSLHMRCDVPNCYGVMILHNSDDHSFLKCHRETCLGRLELTEVDPLQLSCEVCGLSGHMPCDCPSSRPYPEVDNHNDASLSDMEMHEESTRYLFDESECSHGEFTFDFDVGRVFCDWCGEELEDL